MNNLPGLPSLVLLVGGGLLALVGLVTAWRLLRHYRRRRVLAQALGNLPPEIQREVFNDRAIGLHRARGLLLWVDGTTAPAQPDTIDLTGVMGCTLGLTGYRAGEGIRDIFLELCHKDGTGQRLYFFRDGHDPVRSKMALYGKAKYWKRLITATCRHHRAASEGEAVAEEW